MVQIASYPSGAMYAEALQNTNLCFKDVDIRGGSVQLTALGTPRAISGNFASVFHVAGVNGRDYAVKCFTRNVLDQHSRYSAVSTELSQLKKPWQVDFEYQPAGILVQGGWYPVLKMEWIEAQGIMAWLQSNLDRPEAIADVATAFGLIVRDLHNASLAHGDLQHGNLLVDKSGQLRLIDYDGMFVPSLVTRGAAEMGHVNYQSPARTLKDYDSTLDRFAAWLIYVSLLLLLEDPGLWVQFHGDGEEKLLFGRSDFVDQRALSALTVIPELYPAIGFLRSCWSASSLRQIPSFDVKALPTPAELLGAGYAMALPDPALRATSTAVRSASPGGPGLSLDWLTQHLPPVERVTFSAGRGRARTSLAFLVLVLLSLPLLIVAPALEALLVLAAVLVLVAVGLPAYRSQPEFTAKREAAAALAVRRSERKAAEARLAAAALAVAMSLRKEQEEVAAITGLQDGALKRERAEMDSATAKVQAERRRVSDALQQLQQREAGRMREALSRLQESYVMARLHGSAIGRAKLTGIGPVITQRLAAHGILTAADLRAVELIYTGYGSYSSQVAIVVTSQGQRLKIEGLGPVKGNTLKTWHSAVSASAKAGAPSTLPPSDAAAIRGAAEAERQGLMAQQAQLAKRIADETATIRRRHQTEQLRLRRQQADTRKAAEVERGPLLSAREAAQKAANAAKWAEQQASRRSDVYATIRFSRFLMR